MTTGADALVIVDRQSLVEVQLGARVVARIPAGRTGEPMSDAGFGPRWPAFGVAHECLGDLVHLREISADERPDPKAVVRRKTLDWILDRGCEFAGLGEGGRRLCRRHAATMEQGIAVRGLQPEPALPKGGERRRGDRVTLHTAVKLYERNVIVFSNSLHQNGH
jgi:hypothetical protein